MDIDTTFTGRLQKVESKGGWTYIVWPEAKQVLGTGGAVKVAGTIDGESFKSSIMPMGNSTQMLPVNAEIRKKIGKEAGATITVHLTTILS